MENFKNKDSFFTTILREKNAKMFFYASLLPLHHTFTQTYIYIYMETVHIIHIVFFWERISNTIKQLNN